MNRHFQIWTHDWASHVFIGKYQQMINSSGEVVIGDNVYFGSHVIVLKGVTIGDNCIIGAGSVVTKSIPSDTVAAGNPCKVICSLEDYYEMRKRKALKEAVDNVKVFIKRRGVKPTSKDLFEEEIYWNGKADYSHIRYNSIDDFISFCEDTTYKTWK